MDQCRWSVGNYSLTLDDLPVSLNCSVIHVRWGALTQCCFSDGPAFTALCRRWNSAVSVHRGNNFWSTQSNFAKFSGHSPPWLGRGPAKLREKRLRIDWDISEKQKKMVEEVLFQCIALITFEVLNQTSPNFQGSRHNGWEWCLQNYKKNGSEFT